MALFGVLSRSGVRELEAGFVGRLVVFTAAAGDHVGGVGEGGCGAVAFFVFGVHSTKRVLLLRIPDGSTSVVSPLTSHIILTCPVHQFLPGRSVIVRLTDFGHWHVL